MLVHFMPKKLRPAVDPLGSAGCLHEDFHKSGYFPWIKLELGRKQVRIFIVFLQLFLRSFCSTVVFILLLREAAGSGGVLNLQ